MGSLSTGTLGAAELFGGRFHPVRETPVRLTGHVFVPYRLAELPNGIPITNRPPESLPKKKAAVKIFSSTGLAKTSNGFRRPKGLSGG